MKKILVVVIITFVLTSLLYLTMFRIYLGEPKNSIVYNIFEEINDSWFYKLTRYVPREFSKIIHLKKVESFNEQYLIKVNHLISHSIDDYYIIINEYTNEWHRLKYHNKIDLDGFNYYNFLRKGYITREDVVKKYCDIFAYDYDNKGKGFRIQIRSKSDIDSINFLFPYKTHIVDSSKIFKNYTLIPKDTKVEENLYRVVYWYYCGGFYRFDFLFKKDSIELEKVIVKEIGLSGKECPL